MIPISMEKIYIQGGYIKKSVAKSKKTFFGAPTKAVTHHIESKQCGNFMQE
jgi:hypothetical protein